MRGFDATSELGERIAHLANIASQGDGDQALAIYIGRSWTGDWDIGLIPFHVADVYHCHPKTVEHGIALTTEWLESLSTKN